MYTGGPTVVAGAWRGQAGATRGMGRGRALGTAAWVREDEGDPNLQCELSSDRQNGGDSAMYLCEYFPSPEAPCQKVEKKFTCSKGVN